MLTEPHGDAVRYRLLESTRAYASEKLAQSGEHDLLADRHLRYLRDRFGDLLADFERTSRSAPTVEAFLIELEDLRVAISESLERTNILGGAELLAALETVWKNVGLNREGLARLEPFIFERGEAPVAIARLREILPATREGADTALLANILANLTGYSVATGDFRGSLAAGHEALAILAQREPDNYLVACVIEHLAIVAALSNDVCDAAVLEGYADATFTRVGFKREFTEQTSFDRVRMILRDNLVPDEVARLLAVGAALSPEAAIALALQVTAP